MAKGLKFIGVVAGLHYLITNLTTSIHCPKTYYIIPFTVMSHFFRNSFKLQSPQYVSRKHFHTAWSENEENFYLLKKSAHWIVNEIKKEKERKRKQSKEDY